MSDYVALGSADATLRWIGVRRHQAALVIFGIGLTGDWIIRSSGSFIELLTGLLLLACAVPGYDAMSNGELLLIALRYVARTRWTTIVVDPRGHGVVVHGRGDIEVKGYELIHRGRLDLSGYDVQCARTLASFADALATTESSRHVSIHVRASQERARTLLTLREASAPPDGWQVNDKLVAEVAGVGLANSLWLLERWQYVRAPHEVFRVLRISDFTAVPSGFALLEKVQLASSHLTLALHFEVVGTGKAHRQAERAVHRHRSDGAVSSAVGFRQTARVERSLARLAQREALVANGRALMKTAVYVTVCASTYDELRHVVRDVMRVAHQSGLHCERGAGRQSLWYCNQLPGGPSW